VTHAPPTPQAIVVCPLEFERQALRRAGIERLAQLHCCGRGAEAACRWAEESALACGAASMVLLAGLAGSLCDQRPARSAMIADAIVSARGDRFVPALLDSAPHAPTIVTSSLHEVSSAQKRELARSTGAHLVDLESVAFAQQAAARGWRWGVVRGISDDLATTLPSGVEQWTDASGRTRHWRVAASLLRRPGQVGAVLRLGRDSAAAMRGVASLVRCLLEDSPLRPEPGAGAVRPLRSYTP
jgi:adenosylhomocysteine nucleosidase